MHETAASHHAHEDAGNDSVQHTHRPYWKRAHHDWRFWLAVLLMLTAMLIYVMTEDLSMWPRNRAPHPASHSLGK